MSTIYLHDDELPTVEAALRTEIDSAEEHLRDAAANGGDIDDLAAHLTDTHRLLAKVVTAIES